MTDLILFFSDLTKVLLVLAIITLILIFFTLRLLYRLLRSHNSFVKSYLKANESATGFEERRRYPRNEVNFVKGVADFQPRGFFDMLRKEERIDKRLVEDKNQ